MPTQRGDVEARLTRTKDGFVASYRLPNGVGARAAPPPGLGVVGWPKLTGAAIEITFERVKAATPA